MIDVRDKNLCDGLSFSPDVLTHPCNDWQDAERECGDPLRLGLPSSIYALLDPDTKEVRYVGVAASMRQRGKCHSTVSLDGDRPLENWLRRLRLRGKQPHIIELCRTSGARLSQGIQNGVLEAMFIRFMAHYCGRRLLNRQSNPLWAHKINRRGKRVYFPRHRNDAAWLFPIGIKQLESVLRCDEKPNVSTESTFHHQPPIHPMTAFLMTAYRPTTPRSFPITTRHGVRFQGGKKPDGRKTRARGTSRGVKVKPAVRKAG